MACFRYTHWIGLDCNIILTGLPTNIIERLQSAQNATARLIFMDSSYDHITDALISLHWLRVPERILFKIAVLIPNDHLTATLQVTCHRTSPALLMYQSAETQVGALQAFDSTVGLPLLSSYYSRQTSFSSLRCQSLERTAVRHHHITITLGLQSSDNV